jgi:hypothetical protein
MGSPVYSTGISTVFGTKTYTITSIPSRVGEITTELVTSYITTTITLLGDVVTTLTPSVGYSTKISTLYETKTYTMAGAMTTKTLTSYITLTLTLTDDITSTRAPTLADSTNTVLGNAISTLTPIAPPHVPNTPAVPDILGTPPAVYITTTLSKTIYLTKTFTVTTSDVKGVAKEILSTSVFPIISTHTYTITAEPTTITMPISMVAKPSLTVDNERKPTLASVDFAAASAQGSVVTYTEIRTANGVLITSTKVSTVSIIGVPTPGTSATASYSHSPSVLAAPPAPTVQVLGSPSGSPADGSGAAGSKSSPTITKSVIPVAVASSTATPVPVQFTGHGTRTTILGSTLCAFILGIWVLL